MSPTAVLTLPPLPLVTAASSDRAFGIVGAFADAGPVDKVVLGILFAFSVGSWTVMIAKYLQLRRVGDHNRVFLEVFRRSTRFSEINAVTSQHKASPLVGLFQAGYVEIDSQIKAQAQGQQSTGGRYRIQSLTAGLICQIC